MSFGSNLYDLAKRPDDRVLIIQHPENVDPAPDVEAARSLYAGFVVLTYQGTEPHRSDADALRGRDVVVWPWMTAGNLQAVKPLLATIASSTERVRVLSPESPADWIGPADLKRRLNGSGDPLIWPKHRVVDVPRPPDPPSPPPLVSSYVPDDESRDEALNGYYTTAGSLDDGWHEPIDLFTKRALPPFDAGFLPEGIADFVFDQSEIIGADPCMMGISALVCASACIHDGFKLQAQRYNHGWRESGRLWGMLIGDPSKRKTPVLSAAMAHLIAQDFALRSRSTDELKVYARELRMHEASEKAAERAEAAGKRAGHVGAPPIKPPMRALVVQDITPEKFAVLANDNPGGLLLYRDELAGFLGGMDAYSAAKKDAPFWLQSYNGGPWSVDRITRDSLLVTNLSARVLGGIQPSKLHDIAKTMPDDGLLQRFIPVIAQDVDGIGVDREPVATALSGWRSCLDWLLTSRPDGSVLMMSDAALRVREAFERAVIDLQRAHAGQIRVIAHLGKWPGLFVRLCLVHHAITCAVAGHPIAGDVGDATARSVARFLTDYLFDHVRALYDDLEGSDGIHGHARWIAGHILAKGADRITERDMYRASHAFDALNDRDRAHVIRALEYSGWLKPATLNARGRPSAAWEVNPRVHELFSHHAAVETDRRAGARAIIRAAKERRAAKTDGGG